MIIAPGNVPVWSTRTGGSPGATLTRDAGHPSPAGENLARGQTSAAAVVQARLNSPGHAANIRYCSFRAIGVGHDSRGNHWVQDFGYQCLVRRRPGR